MLRSYHLKNQLAPTRGNIIKVDEEVIYPGFSELFTLSTAQKRSMTKAPRLYLHTNTHTHRLATKG